MYKLLFFIGFIFCILNCSDEKMPIDEVPINILDCARLISTNDNLRCESLPSLTDSCVLEVFDSIPLESIALDTYLDFCNSEISFVNKSGETLKATIEGTELNKKLNYEHLRGGPCKIYCVSSQHCIYYLNSDNFSFSLELFNDVEILEDGISPMVISKLEITAWGGDPLGGQKVFKLYLFDSSGKRFESEKDRHEYHDTIILNGKNFSEIYSNEYRLELEVRNKELVYYQLDKGLIAVRDSLGTLWVRE